MSDLWMRVLNMSLAGSVVIAIVIVLRLALVKAPRQYSYWLWAAPALRLLCPVGFSAVISLFSVVPVSEIAPVSDGSGFSTVEFGNAIRQVTQTVLPAPDAAASADPQQIALFIGSLVWVAGMAALLIISIVRYCLTKQLVADAVMAEKGVYETDRISSPFILGIIRPRIYLPLDLDEQSKRYVLAHERVHLRRQDHVIKLLAYLILILHWFNPLVWLGFYLMSHDMEMSCDEAALREIVGSGATAEAIPGYSQALLAVAVGKAFPKPSPLAFSESGTGKRIRHVLRWKQPAKWLSPVMAVVCAAIALGCMANPTPAAKPDPRENFMDLAGLSRDEVLKQMGLTGKDLREVGITSAGQPRKDWTYEIYRTEDLQLDLYFLEEQIVLSYQVKFLYDEKGWDEQAKADYNEIKAVLDIKYPNGKGPRHYEAADGGIISLMLEGPFSPESEDYNQDRAIIYVFNQMYVPAR
ncbi:MAG: hypothetical protein IJM90_08145 [Firmicutes bacterium]|nr:hypothetical protein [Bacillota bacterium]